MELTKEQMEKVIYELESNYNSKKIISGANQCLKQNQQPKHGKTKLQSNL